MALIPASKHLRTLPPETQRKGLNMHWGLAYDGNFSYFNILPAHVGPLETLMTCGCHLSEVLGLSAVNDPFYFSCPSITTHEAPGATRGHSVFTLLELESP